MPVSRLIYLIPALLLVACGDEGGPTAEQAAAPAAPAPAESTAVPTTAPSPAPSAAPAADKAVMTRYIDHAQDEIEFALKKSKAGLESLVQDYDDAGVDSGALKEEIAAIEAKLNKL